MPDWTRRQQGNRLFLGAAGDDAGGLGEQAIEVERLAGQPHAAGFDLRHVEHVVDDVEQVLPAFADVTAVLVVLLGAERPEHARLHDLGKSDDGVERRAQLVAHIGQELGFGLVRVFGPGLFLGILAGEFGELLGLDLERVLGNLQVGHGRLELALAVDQLGFVQLDRGDVGADGDVAAVLGAPLADV